MSIFLQKSLVPWMIALFGMDYPSKIATDLVRQIVATIVKRDSVKNLGKRYDALAEQYPETAEVIAAKYSAGPVCTSFGCFVSNH